MRLESLTLTNFRNFASASLRLDPALSIIIGPNGSGKTSLIESIYYLGYGRSFRSNKHHTLIKHGEPSFTIFAQGVKESSDFAIGVSRTRADDLVSLSINGNRTSRITDMVSMVPVQLFTPQSTDSILSSPTERRRSCDWGLFHVEHQFNSLYSRYNKLLKHRNSLVRSNHVSDGLDIWSQQLAEVGAEISILRENYLEALSSFFIEIAAEFLPEFKLEISYYRGWEKDVSLIESLAKKRDTDIRLGYTSVGPHKADIRIRANGFAIQEILSRGQQRMLVAAFQLSQTIMLRQRDKGETLFLLDDVGAELDSTMREKFVRRLIMNNAQLVITSIENDQLAFLENYHSKKMFHVEHNSVIEQ